MALGLRDQGHDEIVENHEINVTPFIDVMLVLLIIFMVAAPLSTVDVPVELPGSNALAATRQPEPIYLTVQKDLTLSLDQTVVGRAELGVLLDGMTKGDRSQRIYLRADVAVAYGDLMGVMNLLRQAGYLRVALVGTETLPPAAQRG